MKQNSVELDVMGNDDSGLISYNELTTQKYLCIPRFQKPKAKSENRFTSKN
jgi:hypothetical protein